MPTNWDSLWQTLELHARERLGMSKGWRITQAQCHGDRYSVSGDNKWKAGAVRITSITHAEHEEWVARNRK